MILVIYLQYAKYISNLDLAIICYGLAIDLDIILGFFISNLYEKIRGK